MCENMNKGYVEVKQLVSNVMGFNDWLKDIEPIEAVDDKDLGHLGGMNFTISWPNLNDEKTRLCIRLKEIDSFDVQIFQYNGYKQTGLQFEKDISRDGILILLGTMYQEIVSLSNQVLEAHKTNVEKENQIQSLFSHIQIPIMVALLYCIFQTPIIKNNMTEYLGFLYKKNGHLKNIGYLVTSSLFGFLYFIMIKGKELID